MRRRVVVVVNGPARAGKDTACEMIGGYVRKKGWVSRAISSIDPIDEMLRTAGVPFDRRSEEGRRLLAKTKTALEEHDWWATRLCLSRIISWSNSWTSAPSLCFVHIREPIAIAKTRELLGPYYEFKTLFVENPNVERVTSNHADAAIDDMTYDLTLLNDGTLNDLMVKCRSLAGLLVEQATQ